MSGLSEVDDARAERVLLVLLVVIALAVGLVAAVRARSFDPRPDARMVSVGTALVCDRQGCREQ